MGKRADTDCAWNLSKYTVPFSVWELSRPPGCSSTSAMQYQEDVYLLWFQDMCRFCIQLQVSSLSRTGRVCGPELLSVGQRSLSITFAHHQIAAWEEAGLGWIPQRWVTFMLYIIHIFNRTALGVGAELPSMKSPWKTHCGSAGKDQILLMWRREGEHSWQSCCFFQVRNLVNKALHNCTSEKGFEKKIWGASSKEKQSLFACEDIHPALPRLPGMLFEALSGEITCFI